MTKIFPPRNGWKLNTKQMYNALAIPSFLPTNNSVYTFVELNYITLLPNRDQQGNQTHRSNKRICIVPFPTQRNSRTEGCSHA
uniref:Uncharacterized protein n=1 Tax=Rhizophora mucronata TaxID=61149 RepID=A0A2P2JEE8_RHIMU